MENRFFSFLLLNFFFFDTTEKLRKYANDRITFWPSSFLLSAPSRSFHISLVKMHLSMQEASLSSGESVGHVSRILTLYLCEATVPESRSKESTRQRSISRYSLTPSSPFFFFFFFFFYSKTLEKPLHPTFKLVLVEIFLLSEIQVLKHSPLPP